MRNTIGMRTPLLAAVVALGAATLEARTGQSAGGFKVEVKGVKVQGPAYAGDEQLYAFNQNTPGTDVALLVLSPKPGLLKPDTKKCRITKFTDDRGTDLLKKAASKGGFSRDPGFWPFPKVSSDGKACLLELKSPQVPKKGAKSLRLEGELEMRIGQGKVTQKQARVAFRKGASFKVGSASFQIGEVGKPGFGDAEQEIQLKMPADVDKIIKIRFLDASGTELESKRSGSMSFGNQTTWTYELKKAAKSCTVEVTSWKQLSTVTVPMRLTISLGL